MKFRKIILVFSFTLLMVNSAFAQTVTIKPDAPKVFKDAKGLYSLFKLTEEQEKEYLKNVDAETKEYLKIIKENDESRYYQLLKEYNYNNMRFPVFSNIDNRDKSGEEILNYEIMVEALAAKYKKATGNDKSNIKQELEKRLTNLFDLKEKSREKEVKELEARLDELKKKMKLRQNNKSTIIKRRVEELLGEDEYLEWE